MNKELSKAEPNNSLIWQQGEQLKFRWLQLKEVQLLDFFDAVDAFASLLPDRGQT